MLTDGQTYKFAVRIVTGVASAGIETQNTDDYSATVDSDVPAAPVLNAQIVLTGLGAVIFGVSRPGARP